ncbi:MAG: aminotransferase class V-fold PLP-dependent enzyme [Anaeromyxobacter sp.]
MVKNAAALQSAMTRPALPAVGRPPAHPALRPAAPAPDGLDVAAIRAHFAFPAHGRIVTNNAASTQPPTALVRLLGALAPEYENVHRGQSTASRVTTARFEEAYDTIARFIHAPSRRGIVGCRNTTEAHNAVMYMLMTELRDGDNVVTTLMEHNSNYVPWYGLVREILPRFGVKAEVRLARFDPATGQLDLDHLASLVDARTKLVCCTGASNFFGTKNPLHTVRAISSESGYVQPDGTPGSYLLVDGAQLVPSTAVDVQALDADFLSFSFHKLLAPFGVGVLYGRERILEGARPFLYGGDMIADGQVTPEHVGYNALPWKFAAGTPNVLGTILSGQAVRLLLDLALDGAAGARFGAAEPIQHGDVVRAMHRVGAHLRRLTARALDALARVPGLTIYGPRQAERRTALVAFNVQGMSPFELAEGLDALGVESRAGCHCATLAHHALGLDPAASCRLSFYLYNTEAEVDRATAAVRTVVEAKRRGLSLVPKARA